MINEENYARPKPNWIDALFLFAIAAFMIFAAYTGIPGE